MSDGFDDGYDTNRDKHLKPLNTKEKPEKQTAVALKDRTAEKKVPQVIAAGRGNIAEQILQLAFENGINVREDGPLAEMLAAIEIDSPIPSEAFVAVAEILSYVYRANGQPNPFDAVLREMEASSVEEPGPRDGQDQKD